MDRAKLRSALAADLKAAYETIYHLEDYQWGRGTHKSEKELLELQLTHELRTIELRLLAAFETLGLTKVTDELQQAVAGHEDPCKFVMVPWNGEFVNPLLGDLEQFYQVLDPYLPEGTREERLELQTAHLLRVLRGTPRMIKDRDLDPKSEAEVQRVVYETLVHIFPDAVREVPIPKPAKTFKPDFGVRSLRTAIEYKFIDSEADLKQCIGGLYEDVHGYAGSRDWTQFIAVLYTTDAFFTDAQLEAEMRAAGIPENWIVLMVTGRGARQQRGTKRAKKSKPRKKAGTGGSSARTTR